MAADPARLWKLNHRLLTVVLHACATEFDALGLDTKEFFVLEQVGTSPYPAELATALMLPKASVTVYVRNLVARGYLRREIDEADLRRHRLALTDAGEEALATALAALAREFETRLAAVGARDRAHLERILLTTLERDSRDED